jgi:hypothetical protein
MAAMPIKSAALMRMPLRNWVLSRWKESASP